MRLATIKCLNKISYPTEVLMLDFEARFGPRWGLGFKHQSNIEYIQHPEWEFLGCGFQVMTRTRNEDPYFIDGPDISHHLLGLRFKYGKDFEKATFVAKNCKFDMMVMLHHWGIVPKYIIDLDDLLRFYDARMNHHLDKVSKMEKLPSKGDTLKLMNLTFDEIAANPEFYQEYLVDYTLRDIENQTELLERYIPRVEYTPHEAFMARHTLDMYLYPQFKIDRALATRIRTGMTLQLKKVCRKYDAKMLNSGMKLMVAMGDLLAGHSEKIPLKHCDNNKKGVYPDASVNMVPLLEKYGDLPDDVPLLKARPSFAKDDDGCKWMQAHTDKVVRDLIEARIGIKSWPIHIGKVKGILDQSRFDGLHVPVSYYGAHTGRWTGGHGINLLNMGGGGRGGSQHPLISQVRGVLKPPDDRLLSVVDSAQIEARVLAWMAGQHDLVEDFRNDADPYSVLATAIFKVPVWKWDDEAEEYAGQKKKVKLYRGFGKDAILGGGYGMGWLKFYNNCLQNDGLRPYFDTGEYDEVFCKQIINTYRTKYKCIPGFWRKVEKAWRTATRHPGSLVSVLIPRTGIYLKFFNENHTTTIELPSGRKLRYRNASVNAKGELRWKHGILWGGGITENIDQALSRDLMTFWIEILEKDKDYDFRVVLHCYDEIVATVPCNRAAGHLARMYLVMCTCPDWAPGLPLNVEGEISERYGK